MNEVVVKLEACRFSERFFAVFATKIATHDHFFEKQFLAQSRTVLIL